MRDPYMDEYLARALKELHDATLEVVTLKMEGEFHMNYNADRVLDHIKTAGKMVQCAQKARAGK